MRSGQLAHLTGVSTDTLRHYERLGLVPLPQRTAGNYCEYTPAAQQRVELIQRALTIGFSLWVEAIAPDEARPARTVARKYPARAGR